GKFRDVERAVGSVDQFFRHFHFWSVFRHTCRYSDGGPAGILHGAVKSTLHTIDENLAAFQVRIGQQRKEFVAAITGRQIHGAGGGVQRVGKKTQCFVAGDVAELVVVELEVIEV